jgi:ferredoxin
MRVVVDYDRCDSNALCTMVAPALFRLDDDDRLEVLVEQPSGTDEEAAGEAARACPKLAIALVDEA